MRLALLLVFCLAALRPAAAEGPWTGLWDTRWHGGGAMLDLRQDGDRVTGSYPLYGGRIEATARDGVLRGRWIEPDTSGEFDFVLGRDGNSFAGRSDNAEWWNGVRARAPRPLPPLDLSNPREALRSFTRASNLARSGLFEARTVAMATIDFSQATTPRVERLDAARTLFDLLDQTTFRIWSVPDQPAEDAVTVTLEQAGTGAKLPLRFRRAATGEWRIVMPTRDEVASLQAALKGSTARAAGNGTSVQQLRNPRDTMRSFLDGMAAWAHGGEAQALAALDMSAIPEALRTVRARLTAQYLVRVLYQIGFVGLQSIPNNSTSQEPYVHFDHPSGRIIIAPVEVDGETRWKFTAETAANVSELFLALENLPPPHASTAVLIPEWEFFTWRSIVKTHAPALLGRRGPMEYWQVIGALSILCTIALCGLVIGPLMLRGLRRIAGERMQPPSKLFGWLLGLVIGIAIAARISPSLGLRSDYQQFSFPLVGTLFTLSLAYLAWQVSGIIASVLEHLVRRTKSAADDILLPFLLAMARLGIVAAAGLGIAYFLSISTSGLLAGLGIGGLAFAFASRETLSNLFGAGILVVDRPFRRGDYIKAADVSGRVEMVGIRSTRVRTADNTIMIVPNGKLADSTIDNHRDKPDDLQFAMHIHVTGGARVDRLDMAARAIVAHLRQDDRFIPDSVQAGVASIGTTEVELRVVALYAEKTPIDLTGRHQLLLDIARLAEAEGLVLGPGLSAA